MLLYRGERKAKKQHECTHCGRAIWKNETYSVKVVLIIDIDYRYIDVTRHCVCCKRL